MSARVVFKYELGQTETKTIRVSSTAKVVHFARQRGDVFVWIEDWRDAVTDHALTLRIFGTGHDIEDESLEHFLSLTDGPWIWHLYGRRDKRS